MAEEAKDSPSKTTTCEFPEGSLDLLKRLTYGKPGTRAIDGWKTWPEIVQIMNEHFEPVNKMHHPKFTYGILQRKAVAEGWYAPAPPVLFAGMQIGHRSAHTSQGSSRLPPDFVLVSLVCPDDKFTADWAP